MVALETTKRKFHRLLENISSAPKATHSAHLPRLQTAVPPPSKRARLETPHTDAETRAIGASEASNATIRAVENDKATLSRSKSVTNPSDAQTTTPPNYVPWSHERFLSRLKTFANVHNWSSKPDAINEVAWAKRGWINTGFNTVACWGGCEARVVVALRPPRKDENGKEIEGSEDYSNDVDEALVERYEQLLVGGHHEGCLWREAGGCKDDIYRLPIARKHVWHPQLKDRYQSFALLGDDLPSMINMEHRFENLEDLADMLHYDIRVNDAAPEDTGEQPSELNHAALAFALLGWHCTTDGRQSHSTAIATCNACFRRIGLWLYRNADGTSSDQSLKLDLFSNHRTYCPWIDSESQAMPGSFSGLAGWEILQRVIKNDASFRASSTGKPTPPLSNAPDSSGNNLGAESAPDWPATVSNESSPSFLSSKEAKEKIEKEDKARFARLKELTKAMGLGKSKGVKRKLDDG